MLVRGDAIIAKEQDATNVKKYNGGAMPHNYFLFTLSHELQIPLNEWPSNMPQL